MAPIISETREGLQARRKAVYVRLRVTPEEFDSLIAGRALSVEEWDARDELDEIAFLLGDTAAE